MKQLLFVVVIVVLVPSSAPSEVISAPVAPPPPDEVVSVSSQPAHSKLDPILNQLYASRFSPSFVGERSRLDHRVVDGDAVRVVIETKPGRADDCTTWLEARNATFESVHGDLIFATVPLAQLPEIAGCPSVGRIRTPYQSEPHVISQGVALHNADAMHGDGLTGAGVKIGVLDCGGFSGYQGLLGTELPASITLWQGGSGDPVGTNIHGAGCAEIVHDMAPGAELFFAHDETEADFYDAVDWFIAEDVDVVSYSCGWLGEFPFDGAGLPHNSVNAKVEEARAAGILWVNSAGNSADNDNYQATYVQVPGYPWHDFDGDWSNGVFSWSGYGYRAHLTWDDWPTDPITTGATQDYSLQLWYWNGSAWSVVATSDNPQNGGAGQLPHEVIEFTPAVDEWFYLSISKVATTRDCYLNLKKSSNGGFIHFNADRSLTVPADSPAGVTVGAVHWNGHGLEPFSSQGPTLGPGGTEHAGLLKPDLVAADAVDTVTYGLSDGGPWPDGEGFFGTSAACPHVAGAAALLLEEDPSLDADDLADRLTGGAVDQGPSGPDTMYGYGLLNVAPSMIFADGFESGGIGAWSS